MGWDIERDGDGVPCRLLWDRPVKPNQVATDKADHAAHRQKLETLFKSKPRVAIEAEELKALIGDNYQQRISELRRGCVGHWKFDPAKAMTITNVSRTRKDRDGTVHRLAGAYVYQDFDSLGRDSTKPTAPHGNRLLFDLHPRS